MLVWPRKSPDPTVVKESVNVPCMECLGQRILQVLYLGTSTSRRFFRIGESIDAGDARRPVAGEVEDVRSLLGLGTPTFLWSKLIEHD